MFTWGKTNPKQVKKRDISEVIPARKTIKQGTEDVSIVVRKLVTKYNNDILASGEEARKEKPT